MVVKKRTTRRDGTSRYIDVHVANDNKRRKFSLWRVYPNQPLAEKIVGVVDLGKKDGETHFGYAVRQQDGSYLFTPTRRIKIEPNGSNKRS